MRRDLGVKQASTMSPQAFGAPANKCILPVTDRMLAILKREDWPPWLGEVDAPLADVKALFQTFKDGGAPGKSSRSPRRHPSKARPKA